ncbi:hypothetical protein D9756_009776 [Leucocoprinus leucothites]|uniref:Zn(2)-C6 fungal-type domain-containing protein n=1 Tax=Leucocoprinus leucothites TaxID=201217 RepID=A0A8H5CVL7_9AGAR|nr:hypothetical protein D9756_009776 [Leucoagaricus leucothites]
MEQPPSSSQSASTPQIRSRITVVCAECKRLKLKCDRRSPCSSCTKRDTVARCIYSPAAAEKVDLHSLNNRLMQCTERQSTPSTPRPPTATPPSSRNIPFPPSNHQHHHHPAAVTTHVHDAPCPLALSLDELRSAWLDSSESGRSGRSLLGRPHPIKVELSPTDVERQARIRARLSAGLPPHSRHPNPQPHLPALSTYYPNANQPYGSPSYTTPIPSVTPSVLNLLPSTSVCMRILARAKPILAQRPVPVPGGWSKFEAKAIGLLTNRTTASPGGSSNPGNPEQNSNRTPSAPADPKAKKKAETDLPFFAITTAVLAIGAAVSPPELFGPENVNAGLLYALSQQTLSVWEASTPKKAEKDYVLFLAACLAGVGYLLLATPDNANSTAEHKEENEEKPKAIFSLVGKMVNVAREIGLGKEKAGWQEGEERPPSRPDGRDSRRAWEDFRRLVWWDVMFYDLFTSDALGHPSLIPPMSYSVRVPDLTGNLDEIATRRYVIARCRLIQVAQRVKHRLSHPDCCCGYTFDQAAALEDEIRRWSRESLPQDDDEKADERRHNWELSLVAQVLILRVYVPFLISASSAAAAKKQARVPGKPGPGEKPQIQGNAMAMATQSCLGAAQAILRLGNKLNASLFKEPGNSTLVNPLFLDLYPLERLVLDAVIITQSSTAVSVVSEAEVRRGMEIMMDREFALGRERREIWEMMKQRVLVPGKLQIPTQGMMAAIKRKHDQLSPVATSSNDVALNKKEGLPTKHAKTTASPLPVLGVRYRQGRMGPSGPIRQHVDNSYERTNTSRSYTLSNAQSDPSSNSQMNPMAQLQHPIPHPIPRPVGPYDNSPATEFSPEQPMQAQPSYSMPPDHSMNGHRNSFDQTQTKPVYHLEEASMPPNGYEDFGNGGTATHPNSSSSSPYQATTPSYNPPQFGSPDNSSNRTPPIHLNTESPTGSYGGSDSQGPGNHPGGGPPKFGPDQRSQFENSRPTFMTENPQPQMFDKMPPPSAFQPSNDVQSPSLNGTSPADNHAHESAPQFGVPQHDPGHPSAGYFHHDGGLGPYDHGGMLPMGMRMDESVPGTPIFEKSHRMYDKPSQQMIQHNGHSITVNGHGQIVNNSFVDDQAQNLAMAGGPQPPHHQAWSSAQPPQALVGVSAGQPYW